MILDNIVAYTKKRVEKNKEQKPFEALKQEVSNIAVSFDYPFEKALSKNGMSFICEVKKASPSKGIIAQVFDYISIAKEYERIGASAISVLTEPEFFKGSDMYLAQIRENVQLPILRKDFIIDEYQIYEAKNIGADAILLICEILEEQTFKKFLELAHSLGLSVLAEAHNEEQVSMAAAAGAGIIGINNRDLTNFKVDINTSLRLAKLIPDGVIFVSESGIMNADDIVKVKEAGADAVLIGEAFMRSADKEKLIKGLG